MHSLLTLSFKDFQQGLCSVTYRDILYKLGLEGNQIPIFSSLSVQGLLHCSDPYIEVLILLCADVIKKRESVKVYLRNQGLMYFVQIWDLKYILKAKCGA